MTKIVIVIPNDLLCTVKGRFINVMITIIIAIICIRIIYSYKYILSRYIHTDRSLL